jgi:hypothetical protein
MQPGYYLSLTNAYISETHCGVRVRGQPSRAGGLDPATDRSVPEKKLGESKMGVAMYILHAMKQIKEGTNSCILAAYHFG